MLCKMMELLTTFLILTVACWKTTTARVCQAVPSKTVNVMQYGAIGDGHTDDSQALLKAWTASCQSGANAPILLIPAGRTFLLNPVEFRGPCKPSSIIVQISGTIIAPSRGAWTGYDLRSWLMFSNVNGLIIQGRGQIDGQGSSWWEKTDERPFALSFSHCNNLQISGLSYINSPSGHVYMTGCNGVTISQLYITAPGDSPNTDGIDIGSSTNVHIHDCVIGTGDDCIAISGGSSYININNVQCGPGHGISIGSLGEDGKTDTVEEVHVKHCSFRGTTNGARIKTWQGGSGYARKISFEDIALDNVAHPIIIDQYYCDRPSECENQTLAVKVSDITYSGVRGTSFTDEAIELSCSESIACTNIMLKDINIKHAVPTKNTRATCVNAHGISMDAFPAVDCLQP